MLSSLRSYMGFLRKLNAGNPVIVYQMGKVGSSSIVQSLEAQGVYPVFHTHRLNPVNIEAARRAKHGRRPEEETTSLRLYRGIIRKRRLTRFVSLVREPVARNVSAFFQNLEQFAGVKRGAQNIDLEPLTQQFLDEYDHAVPLKWFDKEMYEMLGVDVYATPFPRDKGYLVLREGPFDVMVLRAEAPDAVKAEALQDFLGLDHLEIQRTNVSKQKWYAKAYDDFKKRLVLPKTYLDAMYNTKYTRHFYSDEEIDRICERWSGRAATSPEGV